jgi:uncharacterized protein YukE
MADFSVNSSERETLVTETTNAAKQIREIHNSIKNTCENMSSCWHGDSYTSFKSMCDSFLPSVLAAATFLDAMAIVIGDQVDKPQETLEDDLKKALDV